jgi:hypothetical protein
MGSGASSDGYNLDITLLKWVKPTDQATKMNCIDKAGALPNSEVNSIILRGGHAPEISAFRRFAGL